MFKKVGVVLAWVAGIALVLGILVLVAKMQDNVQTTGQIASDITAKDHATGKLDSPVTLLEYSDFQCPACGAYAPLVEQLMSEYKDKVRFVYRHFPIYSKHPNAEIGGRAAEAAGQQGKFFEYGAILFAKQDEWSVLPDPRDKLAEYAQTLGLNVDGFKTYMNGDASKATVTSDYNGGVKIGITGTPTFFINGEMIQNPTSVAAFRKVLDDALAQNAVTSGTATTSNGAGVTVTPSSSTPTSPLN